MTITIRVTFPETSYDGEGSGILGNKVEVIIMIMSYIY